MTKTDIIKAAAKQTGITQEKAEAIINAAIEAAASALASGEDVKLHHVGTFSVKSRQARTVRNFQTGGPMEIPPRQIITFTAAPHLSALIGGGSDGKED